MTVADATRDAFAAAPLEEQMATLDQLRPAAALAQGGYREALLRDMAALTGQPIDVVRADVDAYAVEVEAKITKRTTPRNGIPVYGDNGLVEQQSSPKTRLLGVAEIFAPLPRVNYLCRALDIAPGAPTLIAGYGFSGKTVAAQDLALAVASGTLAWGTFAVRSGRVIHFDYEQGAYLTRMRYQRLARARGINPADLHDRLTLAALPEWYIDGDTTDELSRLCEGYDLATIDSYRAACPLTDENSSDARVPLDRLTRISDRTGVTFDVLLHARKPAKDSQGGARMSIRGSGALYDACGSALIFSAEKGEPITVQHDKARISGRPHEDFRLWIEDVEIDGDPTAGLRVTQLEAATSKVEQASDRFAETKRRVLALVREEGTVTGGVNVLRARLGLRRDDVFAAIAELERAGALVRGGTYHSPTFSATGTDDDAE